MLLCFSISFWTNGNDIAKNTEQTISETTTTSTTVCSIGNKFVQFLEMNSRHWDSSSSSCIIGSGIISFLVLECLLTFKRLATVVLPVCPTKLSIGNFFAKLHLNAKNPPRWVDLYILSWYYTTRTITCPHLWFSSISPAPMLYFPSQIKHWWELRDLHSVRRLDHHTNNKQK